LSCSGNLWATILYLYLHGLFKAATFYCSGIFIRNYGSQDTRLMGCGAKFFRLDSFFLLFCSGNLAGLPFTVGAYYKFFFFKVALNLNIPFIFIGFIFLGMLAGVVYYFRLTNYAIFDFYKNNKQIPNFFVLITQIKLTKSVRFTPINHLIAVILLITCSIFSVYILT
jgi:NADH:ubiquinone oxidoreductase subunit 5 (subunit L)/multisubunit Na+/H+ antiporter MnhA subunit